MQAQKGVALQGKAGLSQNEAARLIGASRQRVAALIQAGRIIKLEDGSLCEASVRECGAALAARRGGQQGGNGGATELPSVASVAATLDAAALPADWAALTLPEALQAKERAIAWLRTMEAQEKAGQLVPVETVAAEWESVCGAIREKVLGLAARATARLGLGADGREVLDGLVREALVDLSASD